VGNPAVLDADSMFGLLGVQARNTLDIQVALLGVKPKWGGCTLLNSAS
jgi:hypothetical protein